MFAPSNITAFATQAEAKDSNLASAEYGSSLNGLNQLAANWSGARLVELWSGLPGKTPVKKFTGRKTAIAISRQMMSRYAHIRTEAKRKDVQRNRAAAKERRKEANQKQNASAGSGASPAIATG